MVPDGLGACRVAQINTLCKVWSKSYLCDRLPLEERNRSLRMAAAKQPVRQVQATRQQLQKSQLSGWLGIVACQSVVLCCKEQAPPIEDDLSNSSPDVDSGAEDVWRFAE